MYEVLEKPPSFFYHRPIGHYYVGSIYFAARNYEKAFFHAEKCLLLLETINEKIKLTKGLEKKDIDFISELGLSSVVRKEKSKKLTKDNLDVKKVSCLIFDKDKRNENIEKKKDLYNELQETDDDIDMEECGRYIEKKRKIVVDDNHNIVFNYRMIKKLTSPEGLEKEKIFDETIANINIADNPLIISNKNWVSKEELFKKYIFNKNYFIKHLNREQFDSLYKLAEVIAYDREEKKRKPLFLLTRGKGYPKAYLEGRINNNKFCLILHLSDREFILTPKKPIEPDEEIEIEEKLSDKLIKIFKLIRQTFVKKRKEEFFPKLKELIVIIEECSIIY